MGSGNDILNVDNGVSGNLYVSGEAGERSGRRVTKARPLRQRTTSAPQVSAGPGWAVAVTAGSRRSTCRPATRPTQSTSRRCQRRRSRSSRPPTSVANVSAGATTHVLPSLAYGLTLIQQGTINLTLDDGSDSIAGDEHHHRQHVSDLHRDADLRRVHGRRHRIHHDQLFEHGRHLRNQCRHHVHHQRQLPGVGFDRAKPPTSATCRRARFSTRNVLTINDARRHRSLRFQRSGIAHVHTVQRVAQRRRSAADQLHHLRTRRCCWKAPKAGDTFNIQSTGISSPDTVLGGLGTDNFYVGSTTVTGGAALHAQREHHAQRQRETTA